jgi:hypothetical protein
MTSAVGLYQLLLFPVNLFQDEARNPKFAIRNSKLNCSSLFFRGTIQFILFLFSRFDALPPDRGDRDGKSASSPVVIWSRTVGKH